MQNSEPKLDLSEIFSQPNTKHLGTHPKKVFASFLGIAIVSGLGANWLFDNDNQPANSAPEVVITKSPDKQQPENNNETKPKNTEEPQKVDLIAQLPADCVVLGDITANTKASVQWTVTSDGASTQVAAARKSTNDTPDTKVNGLGRAEVCFSGQEVIKSTENKVVVDMSQSTIDYKLNLNKTTSEVRDMTIDKQKIGDFVLLALNTSLNINAYNKTVSDNRIPLIKASKLLLADELGSACEDKVWEPTKEVAKYYLTQQYTDKGYTGSVELVFKGAPEITTQDLALSIPENPEFSIVEPITTCKLTPITGSE